MGKCKQCGECCSLLVFSIPANLPEDFIKYYEAHGCTIDHVKHKLLVPARCNHLTEDNLCAIHEDKPDICKNYTGQEQGYYVPENCGYKEE